jgi:hypothetical protein
MTSAWKKVENIRNKERGTQGYASSVCAQALCKRLPIHPRIPFTYTFFSTPIKGFSW